MFVFVLFGAGLSQHNHRVFQVFDDRFQQFRPKRAVDDPVIDAQRDRHHRGNGQFAILAHDRFLDARAYSQDRAMRRVDHRIKIVDAEHAEVGDGEGSADILMRREFLVAGATGQVLQRSTDGRLRWTVD